MFWPLKDIEAHPNFTLDLVVMGAHLSKAFGETVNQIQLDGFEISAKLDCLDPEDSDIGMSRTIGTAVEKLTKVLSKLRPDMVLLIADRYEMLAPAAVALALRIPIAHIEGGDISEGAIDDAVRNAITKMAHLHFTPTEEARRRVLAMGEESWRVVCSGAPSLDHLVRSRLPSKVELEKSLGQRLESEVCVVACHPVTLHPDTTAEICALFEALPSWSNQVVFCFPNADAGSSALVERTRAYCSERKNCRLYTNLDHLTYWSLLSHATFILGNSSSGIMEAASVPLPAVDIGERQRGRTRAANVVHAPSDKDEIIRVMELATSEAFTSRIKGLKNPYGDGHASQRIISGLLNAPEKKILLEKKALPLEPDKNTFLQNMV